MAISGMSHVGMCRFGTDSPWLDDRSRVDNDHDMIVIAADASPAGRPAAMFRA